MAIVFDEQVRNDVGAVLERLEAGEVPGETKRVDFKEEAGRRGAGGVVLPGELENQRAAKALAAESACMANTPGGGALIVGVEDQTRRLIGSELDAEWLRFRIYQLLDRKLTVEVEERMVRGHRILVLCVPQAVEPIRYHGRITWRIADNCVEVDASTWHQARLGVLGYDWSGETGTAKVEDVVPTAVEVARRWLRESGEAAAEDLAAAPIVDLLRRLNCLDSSGRLNHAAALCFVGRADPMIDYVHRPSAGADSDARVRPVDTPLLTQLAEVFTTATANNPIRHSGSGLVIGRERQVPERALREAIVNGIAHRDWHDRNPTHVEHVGGVIRVTSPGGFVDGVTPENIITHPSRSRNTRLAELLAKLRVAEREGVGVDRMYGALLQAGLPAPVFEEMSGPVVRATLIGNNPDDAWRDWIRDPGVASDLKLLMTMKRIVERGWTDLQTLAPELQVSDVEAQDALASLQRVTIGMPESRDPGSETPAIMRVAGIPDDRPGAWTLSHAARASLEVAYGKHGRPSPLPARKTVALDYARARGRISSTELASLCDTHATNVGRQLKELEKDGELGPSRDNRRGPGFFYRYVGESS